MRQRSRTLAGVLLFLVTAAASASALGSASAADGDAAPLRGQEQPAKPAPLDVSEMEAPATLNWLWEFEETLSSRDPGAASVEQHDQVLQQAAQRSPSVMAAALVRDIQQVQAAAAAATRQARATAHGQAEARTAPGITFAIGFSNESTIALSSSPFNATERGAVDIRAGWARSRRMVRLPGNTGAVQEVVQTELFLSVSGLALLCIGVGVLLLVLAACMPSSGDSGDADDTAGDAEDQRAAFIKDDGYTKL